MKMDWNISKIKSAAKMGRRAPLFSSTSKNSSSNSPTSANPLQHSGSENPINIDLDTKNDSLNDQKLKSPPKKVTSGWTEKKSKNKGVFEEDRLNSLTATKTRMEEIPIIPDLDDIQDEILMNEIVEPLSVTMNRVVTLKELDSDLLKQSSFLSLEDIDLTILMKHLQPLELLEEPDEEWEWDKTFSEVTNEIYSKSSTNTPDNTDAEETVQTRYIS